MLGHEIPLKVYGNLKIGQEKYKLSAFRNKILKRLSNLGFVFELTLIAFDHINPTAEWNDWSVLQISSTVMAQYSKHVANGVL